MGKNAVRKTVRAVRDGLMHVQDGLQIWENVYERKEFSAETRLETCRAFRTHKVFKQVLRTLNDEALALVDPEAWLVKQKRVRARDALIAKQKKDQEVAAWQRKTMLDNHWVRSIGYNVVRSLGAGGLPRELVLKILEGVFGASWAEDRSIRRSLNATIACLRYAIDHGCPADVPTAVGSLESNAHKFTTRQACRRQYGRSNR